MGNNILSPTVIRFSFSDANYTAHLHLPLASAMKPFMAFSTQPQQPKLRLRSVSSQNLTLHLVKSSHALKVPFPCQNMSEENIQGHREMQTKARLLFQWASSLFFFSARNNTRQCAADNRSLYEREQNRVGPVVRSGREDETKRDESDDLHFGVVSHSAMKRHRRGVLRAAASCGTITPIRHNHAARPNTFGKHYGSCSPSYSSSLLSMAVQINQNISHYQQHLTFT